MVTAVFIFLGEALIGLASLGVLQKSLHSQTEGWAESQVWPIRISNAPHTVRDSWKTQSEPRGQNYGNVHTFGVGRVSAWSCRAISRRGPAWD